MNVLETLADAEASTHGYGDEKNEDVQPCTLRLVGMSDGEMTRTSKEDDSPSLERSLHQGRSPRLEFDRIQWKRARVVGAIVAKTGGGVRCLERWGRQYNRFG